MTVLDPSRRPWDVTPKRYITTTSHRMRHDPELNRKVEQAQFTQSQVYDTVLEHFDRHTALPFQAPAGKPSLCKWITSARAGNEDLAKVPVALARGAGSQARLAWLTKDTFEQDKAGTILAEQEKEDAIRRGEAPHPNNIEDEEERKKHEPSPRLVRLWSKEPEPNRRRGQARRALRLLVPCTPVRERAWNEKLERHERKAVPGRWHLPGLGQLELLAQDEIPAGVDIRSCHLVERTRPGTPVEKRRYILKVQVATPVPETKDGGDTGADYGVRNTVTTSTGQVLQRPDTSILEDEARALRAHAKKRCKKHSRRYEELYREAKALSQKVKRIHDNWECQTAKTLCDGTEMIAREDLKLRNMTASGAGTPSAPGSNAKKGLNQRAQPGPYRAPGPSGGAKSGANRHQHSCRAPGEHLHHVQRVRAQGPGKPERRRLYLYRMRVPDRRRLERRGQHQDTRTKHLQRMEGNARAGAGGTLVQAGSRRGSGTGTAGEGGAWRSAPGQPQRLPLASKHHRRHQGTALSVDLWI